MKRLFQIGALVAVALLPVQPALAGELCAMGTPMGVPHAHCADMAMSQMDANCPMHAPVAGIECDRSSCRDCLLTSTVQLATVERPKAGGNGSVAVLPRTIESAGTTLAAAQSRTATGLAPDRCILFQVFRI